MIKQNSLTNEILNHHKKYKLYINQLLRDYMSSLYQNGIVAFLDYALFPGRRLRSSLLKLLCSYDNENRESEFTSILDRLCIAIELCHRSSLILDDLIDGDTTRRNIPTFHTVYGQENTVLTSHYMVAESYRIIESLPKGIKMPIYQTYSEAYHKIVYGEFCDIGSVKDVSFCKMYSEKSLLKTSAAFELVFVWASIIKGFENTEAEHMRQIGTKIGELYQIYNDVYDDLSSDIDERGKKNMYKVNLSLMNCILLDYGDDALRDKILFYVKNDCTKSEYKELKEIQSREKYREIAKGIANTVDSELFTTISAFSNQSLRQIVVAFSNWLKQEKCWNQNEFENAGY